MATKRPNSQESSPVVSIRMTRPQRTALDAAAEKAGISRAAFIRRGIWYAMLMAEEMTVTPEMIQAAIDKLERELS